MKSIPLDVSEVFGFDGRGPCLEHWLVDSDLLFEDSSAGFAEPSNSPVGAQVYDGWVVFHGLQVIQIVPEEVHTYWHFDPTAPRVTSSASQIEDSAWLSSFDPRHLSGHHHFVVTFYDDLVEVVCRELLFGMGDFNLEQAISQYPQLSYAYLRRAMSKDKQDKHREAAADYKHYIEISPQGDSVEYARRCLSRLETM